MGVKFDDIILFEMNCKFHYKNYEVTVNIMGELCSISIIGIRKEYIITGKKCFTHSEFNHLDKIISSHISIIQEIIKQEEDIIDKKVYFLKKFKEMIDNW